MKKLTLRVDDLQVTTFTTASDASSGMGTVRGRGATEDFTCNTCYDPDCNNDGSDYDGCSDFQTCWGCVGGGGGGTIGVHCGPQGTMNPLYGTCAINTQAGATCDGSVQSTCGAYTACC